MSVDIVNLIESNPVTKLQGDYQSKLVEKMKNNFSTYEQQLFLASFYCYLNYNPKMDFLIDLDNVWQWLGFSQKARAKELLEKHFIVNKDYTLLSLEGKQTNNCRGGHNKQTFLLNVETFKKVLFKGGYKESR